MASEEGSESGTVVDTVLVSTSIEAFLNRCNDICKLMEKIIKNCQSTSDKKFRGVNGRKILLNILKLPVGHHLFFELNLQYHIAELLKDSSEFESAATENYLLYYSDDYNEVKCEEGKQVLNHHGEVLFIIPLKAGLIEAATECIIS